jgi:ankyrin repeat protein
MTTGKADNSSDRAGSDDLHRACYTADWPSAISLIRQNIGLTYKDAENWGVLHMALFSKAPYDVIKLLLEHLPAEELNMGINNGSSPIYLAAEKDVDPEIVRLLLDKGADPNQARNDTRGSAVTMAAQQNVNPKLMKLLLTNGRIKGDPNHRNFSDVTPVFMATQRNVSLELMKLLLANGGDPNIPNKEGGTAIFMAAQKNVSPELMRLLLEAQGEPNRARLDGCTPLIFAAHQNVGVHLMLVLLEYGANPYLNDPSGKNAIDTSKICGNANLHVVLQGVSVMLSLMTCFQKRIGVRSSIAVLPIEIFRRIKSFLYSARPE